MKWRRLDGWIARFGFEGNDINRFSFGVKTDLKENIYLQMEKLAECARFDRSPCIHFILYGFDFFGLKWVGCFSF